MRSTRRQFLRTASSIGSLAAMGDLDRLAAALPGADPFERFPVADSALDLRGIWWFYPSFLEFPEGPWGSRGASDADPLRLWKSCLSWLADHGLNAAFIHFGPFGGDRSPLCNDRVRTGWGYHYLLDFARFPEARTFDRATLRRNRDLLNAICAHGRKVGVGVYTHAYNFSVTAPFLNAHRDALCSSRIGARSERQLHVPGVCDRLGLVHKNVCWNKPLMQEFSIACWEETFAAIPELEGILVTPGENAKCPCVDCVGPTDDDHAAYVTSPPRLKTLGHFVSTFADVLHRLDRKPMVRAWAAGKSRPWIEVFPRGVPIFLKYSVFDVMDAGPDPALKEWVDAGHVVVATPEIQGGENGGPTLWRSPEYLAGVARKTAEAGCAGIVACVNSEHGFLMQSRPEQMTPAILFAHAAATGGAPAGALSVEWDRRTFGAAGDAIHAALEDTSAITFALPRVVFEAEEGYTWQFDYHFFSDEWPGRIGVGITADDWAARDVANLADWLEWLRTHAFVEPVPAEALGGRRDPLDFLRDVAKRVERGAKAIAELEAAASDRSRFVLAGGTARLHSLLAREWIALLGAKMAEQALLGPNDETVRAALRARALADFDAAIAALEATIAEASRLPAELLPDELMKRVPRKLADRRDERAELARRLTADQRSR